MKKKALWGLVAVVCCSACGAPSLRYKHEVNNLVTQGKFDQAAGLVESKARKMYGKRDGLLYALDRGTLLHDAQQPAQSDALFAVAQQQITDSYTKSISASGARLLINDLTTPYYASYYEIALTFFYRAINFLQLNDISAAAVEARKAVFFLDHLRGSTQKGYNDDPFVQYVSSIIFESSGDLSDARIARENALNAYRKRGWATPFFDVPSNAQEYGEVIVFHYVGQVPLKKSQTIQVAWNDIWAFASTPVENEGPVSPELQNVLYAGLTGSAITVAYPVLEPQSYLVESSTVDISGLRIPLQKMSDIAELAKQDLEMKLPGIWFRLATRAVLKRIAAVQARHAVQSSSDSPYNDSLGQLAELFISILGAATERADTRQWFTLPAQVYMTRVFVTPGKQNIRLLLQAKNGSIIGEHTFANVEVPAGGRVFLHHRSGL